MVDFILRNLYIIVIIAFAIFTAISSRSGKNKSRNPRQGMPTFGGGPDTPGRRIPGSTQTTQEREEEAQRRYREAQREFDQGQMGRGLEEGSSRDTMSQEGTYRSEGPNTASDSAEGSRMEPATAATEMGRTADQYRNEMQKRLDQLTSGMNDRLGRIDLSPTSSPSSIEVTGNTSSSTELRLDPAQAAQGVLWAEILSPPRSRHAGSFGRKTSREGQSTET